MADLQSIQVEFRAASKHLSDMNREVQKAQQVYSAYLQLLRAYGGDPAKTLNEGTDSEADKTPRTIPLPLAMSLPEVIREAIPAKGKSFVIDDIFASVHGRFPTATRGEIANILWRLSQQGGIETVQKGKRGTPAKYVRR